MSDDPIARAAALADEYARDGTVFLPQVLDAPTMAAIERAFEWKFRQWLPLPGATSYDDGMRVVGDNSADKSDLFAGLMRDTILPDIARALIRSEHLWLFGEQLFWKKSQHVPRTPWHQDAPYYRLDGRQSAVLWIALNDLPREACLETIRGSHRGTIYNGSAFMPGDDTEPIYLEGDFPRLPDVEADRSAWDIAGWEVKRGDVIVFHIGCMHGGAPTWPGLERKSISFRFLGDDIVTATRPPFRPGFGELFKVPTDDDAYAKLAGAPPGTPIGKIEGYQQVR
jgi:ectoine hydroxylase-related dioxygenase (phytanoyl-CoA dioxygenase family)